MHTLELRPGANPEEAGRHARTTATLQALHPCLCRTPLDASGASADEALLPTAWIIGTFTCAANESRVNSHSSDSNETCAVQDDILLSASQAQGVSLLAIMGGSLACSALAAVGQRQGPCRKVVMWLLVTVYVCCCLLFCAAFIANILEPELRM